MMSDETKKNEQLSRRGFLRGVFIATASIPVAAAGCAPTDVQTTAPPAGYQPAPLPPLNEDVPLAIDLSPNPTVLRTFATHEARTVEVLTARIMPGTPEDPGAREAGVVIYIDTMLSYNEGFPESTYREPPYAQLYDGETPPESDAPFETVWVSADEMERYGYQSVLSPREVYRLGIVAVDAYASSKFSRRFIELSESEQDEIVGAMADGTAEAGFDQIAAESFFRVLRRHTAEGMFSDPAYGGNRNMVGWQLLGYPGAQRAYTESDIRAEHTPHRPPQSLAMMHAFSPGQYAGEHVVLPVSGSNEDYPVHHDHP
jgi:hypothetical protein